MPKRTAEQLAEDLSKFNLEGKVVGVHSNLSVIGLIAPTPVSDTEKDRGLSPIAKTVIDAYIKAVGPNGTFFVPTHSVNSMSSYMPDNLKIEVEKDAEGKVVKRTVVDDGYYNPKTSPSTVGALTQSVIQADGSIRSEHPTHSICALGKEAEYLVKGHTPLAQAVGIHNAFTKTAGLDGVIMFIGEIFQSNTTFHAYETLLAPKLAEYFVAAAAADWGGVKRLFPTTWVPSLHRDFYMEKKRRTRAGNIMRDSGLLQEGKLGRGKAFAFPAKAMAKLFADEIFPKEPDIMFCNRHEDCQPDYNCLNSVNILKSLYGNSNGGWESQKIEADMSPDFLALLKPGEQRVSYN